MSIKDSKNFVLITVAFSVSIFFSYLLIVYIIDPVGLNNKFNLGLIKDPSYANRTQKYIELKTFKPQTIMLGGSRVQFLNTDDLAKYTQDRVYNLAFSTSTLEEQYYFLKHALDNYDIKNVIIGVNLYPFSETSSMNKTETDFDKKVLLEGLSLSEKLRIYLELPLRKYLVEQIKLSYSEPLQVNGARTAYKQRKVIANNSWKRRKTRTLGIYEQTFYHNLTWSEEKAYFFKKMINLCKDNGTDFHVFTTTVHNSQLKLLQKIGKLDVYFKWKEELANLVPYWDFMLPSSVSSANENFIDPAHLKQELGFLYFARLFEDDDVIVPEDFGKLVSKSNIKSHLKYNAELLKSY